MSNVDTQIVIPPLQPHEVAWVVTSPDGAQQYELRSLFNVRHAAARGWKVVTIGQHLSEVQKRIDEESQPKRESEEL